MPEYYEIVVRGRLDPGWSDWFQSMQLSPRDGNETMLSGELADQAALYGLIERLRDLNLTLISVSRGGQLPNCKE